MAASGAQIDERRILLIGFELDRDEYSHSQAQLAERWILRGAPARYGKLTLADFYPTAKELTELGIETGDILRAEYERGYAIGYQTGRDAGIAEECERWKTNREYIRERTMAAEAVDLTAKINTLIAREAALAEREKRFDKRMGVSEIKHAESTTPTPAICAEPVSTLGDALRDVAKQQGIKISPTNHKEKTT